MDKFIDFIRQVFSGKSIYRILFNWQVEKYCRELSGQCIDLAGGKKPSYYRYWNLKPPVNLIKTDSNDNKNPDLRVDLNEPLPFKDGEADNIFLFNAIYILREPQKSIKEIHRVLKSGGSLFVASPLIFNEAKEPDDFIRYTSQGLTRLLVESGFTNFQVVPFGERFSAAAHLLHSVFYFNIIRLPVFALSLWLDWLVSGKFRKLHPCPLGYFVIAKK